MIEVMNDMSATIQTTHQRWQAVLERDKKADGVFVYAVTSTGIYCRPSCPARKPSRENASFYPLPELAERAGYRPCKRCKPDQVGLDPRAERVREMCRYLEANVQTSPTLGDLATRFGMSPAHLQRSFKQAVGLSPLEYLATCRMNSVKQALREESDISGALYDAGYGSSSRLYEKAASQLGMTPGRYKKQGEGVQIFYTITASSLGKLLVATTTRGLCAVRLGDSAEVLETELCAEFARAEIKQDDGALATWVEAILEHLEGERPKLELPLDIQATAFQRRVWQELQRIPYGETRSYSEIAQAIGKPSATRAVAGACAANPVALVTPCHRVVRSDGSMGGYRWGMARKREILANERKNATAEG